jgi:RND family efflux transporter MFP subunit
MTDTLTPSSPAPRGPAPLIALALVLIGVLGAVWVLYRRANPDGRDPALGAAPKGVTVTAVAAATYQPARRYVGTVEPWVQAKLGPQLVSAYVDTVLVRPGDQVKRGAVLATLDCRNASAVEQGVAAQARAVAAQQTASASEAARLGGLLDGGFVSQNEVEQKRADSVSKEAQLLALQARVAGTSLEVADCVQRAPFDGEIGDRHVDPGAFVRPGTAVVTLVDRRTVRVTAEVPETDFAAVAPGTAVRLRFLATGGERGGTISRRAPAADPGTRTAHIEIDVDDAARILPVWTTAEISLDVGAPVPAIRLPVVGATVRGAKAALFVVEAAVAHARTLTVLGERAGQLYLEPKLAAGAHVVVEGRAQLDDGDVVAERLSEPPPEPATADPSHAGSGAPR